MNVIESHGLVLTYGLAYHLGTSEVMMSHTHNTGKLLPSGLLSRAAANFILCVEGWHFYAPPSVETERRVVESYDGNLL